MPSFSYKAMDKSGKELKGRIEAASEQAVIERLRGMGYFPTDVAKAKGSGAGQVNLEELPIIKNIYQLISGGRVKGKNIMTFTRQLATLIGAGLPIRRSLSILCEQTDSTNLQHTLNDISEQIEGGGTLAEAMGSHPNVFNKLYVNMVKAGEISGDLEAVLDRLALFLEKRAALRSKVQSAMYYPIFVTVLITVIVTGILIFIVPRFEEIYTSLGGQLPFMTQILVTASQIILKHSPFVILAFILLGILYWQINKTDKGKFVFDTIKLKLPVFGSIIQKAAIARFARTFGTLLNTGVPILQTLVIVKDTSGNEVVARAMVEIHQSIREGETISEPMRNFPIFPPLVCHMIAVGEETGAIDQMLVKVAEAYEREVDSAVDGLTALIEPILIIMLGVTVGFIVIALYMPIFKIGDVIK